MTAVIYLLAGLIVLVRVYVPINMSVLGQWPVRFTLLILWYLAIKGQGGTDWQNFVRTLRGRSREMACYMAWLAVLTCFWIVQGGEHVSTSWLLTAYIGAIPFYFLGTYFTISGRKGRGLALAVAIVVGATCLMAIPSVWKDPGLVRLGAIDMTSETRSLGIGSYGDLTGFAVILPFTVTVVLGSHRAVRILGIAACGATVALLIISTFSGLILLTGMAMAGCALYYLALGGTTLRRVLWVLVAAIAIGVAAVAAFPGVYERTAFAFDKIGTTATFLPEILSGEQDDPTMRYELMLQSLSVFVDNPVVGTALVAAGVGTPGTGGHSSWIDALANYGLLGCMPYILWHVLVVQRLWRLWRSDRANAVYWGCLLSGGLYLFYGLFNVTTQPTTVALFMYVVAAGGRTMIPLDRRCPVGNPGPERS